VRTCCNCSSCDSTTSCSAPAGARHELKRASSSATVAVNGKRVTIPSYTFRKGDVVTLRDKARSMIVIRHNLDTLDRQTPQWLETGEGGMQVAVRELPVRAQIDVPVREQLIVELYSK